MNLINACCSILDQLAHVIAQLHEQDFSRPSVTLGNSTIGQHLRHTLEFFLCFEKGYVTGCINYDKRNHDKTIERDKAVALAILHEIGGFVKQLQEDKPLILEVNYNLDKEVYNDIKTNVKRELVYNIEHTIHHIALMKIGIREVAPYVQIPEGFGVASSTLRFNKENSIASY